MRTAVLLVVVFGISACVGIPGPPMVETQLKLVSAGHTGCLPDENELTNIHANPDGSGTWNATCKGKVYLCSAASAVVGAAATESYSCAPAAQ